LSSRDFDLVVIGDCNPDVLVLGSDVTPAFGQQEKLVERMSLEIGGSASITAVAAARLGLRVALVAAVGPDAGGTFMLDALAREGVDVSGVVVREGMATGMTVALSRGGDRAILTALGAMDSLTAADIPAGLLGRCRHVHVSSYFLLADSLGPGLAAVLSDARAAGAATSLDTNWDPAERWRDEQLSAAIAQADLLLPNEAEALALSSCSSVSSAALSLLALGPQVAVKLGARGVLVGVDPSGLQQVSLPPVTPVDTTGAGDCFNAGLIAGLLRGLPLPEAAALGCATGALSTGALGGTTGAPGLEKATDLAAHATFGAFALSASCTRCRRHSGACYSRSACVGAAPRRRQGWKFGPARAGPNFHP
jgi:sugar/nucleoside kinase (ribokinase family)